LKDALKSLLALLCLVVPDLVAAQVGLQDKAQLIATLSGRLPCCVIDGRSDTNRKREALKDALPWRSDLMINPTATVIVVADRDQEALRIANDLGRRHPGKPILAVKGGLGVWKAVSFSLLMNAGLDGPSGAPASFVIPANTCEQGTPLQELRSDKKK
jgi:hypothetical protein